MEIVESFSDLKHVEIYILPGQYITQFFYLARYIMGLLTTLNTKHHCVAGTCSNIILMETPTACLQGTVSIDVGISGGGA